jgi:hypothetical protein
MHKTVNPVLVNSSGFILALLVHLTLWRGILKIKKQPFIWVISLTIITFALSRRILLPPPQFEIYDIWMLSFGLFFVLDASPLKSLLRFSSVLLTPLALSTLYTVPLSSLDFSLLSAGGFFIAIITSESTGQEPSEKRLIFLIALLSIIAFTLLSLQFLVFEQGKKKGGKILFDTGHGTTEGPLLTYDRNITSGAPFGHSKIAKFLSNSGYSINFWDKDLSKEALRGYDTLVLIMCSKPYSKKEIEDIWQFVEKGGSLLVIGDHTDIDNVMSTLNPVIEHFGIRLRFDTIWLSTNKRGPVIYASHPVLWNLKEVSLSVGASLDLSAPAKPLLMTSYGIFSDKGNPMAPDNAYIGNSALDRDEQVGDLILAAASRYQKGKVLVFSDSAYFQNTSLYRNYAFAYQVFDWLNRDNSQSYRFWLWSIPFFVLLFVLALYYRGRPLTVLPVCLALSLIASIAISSSLNARHYPQVNFKAIANKVLFDFAHHNEYSTYWYLRDHSNVGVDSLIQQAIRIDYHPFIKEKGEITYDELKDYGVYVSIAPNVPFTSKEIESISRYVKEGGGFLVLEGPRKWSICNPLIEKFKLSKEKYPIGIRYPIFSPENLPQKLPYGSFYARFSNNELTEGVGYIFCVNPCKVMGGEPVAFIYDLPVMTTVKYGKGKVVLVGDDRFFANYVSETEKLVVDPNKLLLTWNILKYLNAADSRRQGVGR